MRILLVSGIFVASQEFRNVNLQESSETLLADGLRARGIDVKSAGHDLRERWGRFDVVHLHHLANACLKLFVPQKSRIVFTRHATKALPAHHQFVLSQTYRAADRVVVLSDTEAAMSTKAVDVRKLRVIPNGVNSNHFRWSERERPGSGIPWRLLYVGQLVELKRVHIAIDAIRYLSQLGLNVHLDVVHHRDTLKSELMCYSRKLGVEGRVSFLGAMSRSDLGVLMQKSHMLLLPSRTEALPTVVTEAVLSGLPVVAFQVGGIREQLPSWVRLPNVLDMQSFLASVLEVVHNYEDFIEKYGAHAQDARRKFSVEAMVDSHVRMYEEVANEAK